MNTPIPAAPPGISRPTDPVIEQRVRAALLDVVYHEQPLSLAASAVFGLAMAVVYAWVDPNFVPWLWFAGMSLVLAARYVTSRQYVRAADRSRNAALWARRFFVGATGSAVCWGLIAWYSFPSPIPLINLSIIILIVGVVSAASRTVACHPRSFVAFTGLCLLPLAARLALSDLPAHLLMAGFAVLYFVLVLLLGRGFRATVANAFRLQFENADLALKLRQDIAAREAAEAALRTSQERLRFTQHALDRAQDLVAIISADGRLVQVNDAFCRHTQRSAAELVGRMAWDGIVNGTEETFCRHWQEVRTSGAKTFEIEIVGRDGRLIPVEVSASHVKVDGQEAVCAIARDLAPRRAAEQEKARLQQQFQEAQRLESLGVLAGGIAHDFNNLLTTILGNATLARDTLDQPQAVRSMLREIESASNHAAGLCRQMLAYAGRGQLAVQPLDLSEVVAQSAKLLEATVGRRAQLELNLGPELPAVLADASQLRQVVINLVHNAAEAMGEANGRIIVTTSSVTIDGAMVAAARGGNDVAPGPGVALTVWDNGSGMTPDTQKRIFEPFFTTKFTGRGLGLAAVLGVVRSHGGLLHVESQVGRGSTFRVVFPCSARKAARQVAAGSPPVATPRTQQGRVLVIDDEEPVRAVVQQFLERLGFAVHAAADGTTALECPRLGELRLMLVDLTMPGISGIDTLRSLRQRGAVAPAILMSGFSEQQVRAKVNGDRAVDFIQKPFDLAALQTKIEQAVSASG